MPKKNAEVSKILASIRDDKTDTQPSVAPVTPVKLSTKLVTALNDLESNQTDLSVDLRDHKRTTSKKLASVESSCNELDKRVSQETRGLSLLQEEFTAVRDTTDKNDLNISLISDRLDVAEDNINRLKIAVSTVGKEVAELKKNRLTTTHLLLAGVIVTLVMNGVIRVVGVVKVSDVNSRLSNVETVLQDYLN